MEMLKLNGDILTIELPQGKTQQELLTLLAIDLTEDDSQWYGKDLKVFGRITTAMSMYMGHYLAHLCKSVSIFDPKENDYVVVIKH